VVLEQASGRFTNYIPLEFTNDGCDSVEELRVGDDVEVSYRLSGRKWQRDAQSEVKYFLSAEAVQFKVMRGGATGAADDFDPNSAFQESSGEDVPF
jgi:hypothetical protein